MLAERKTALDAPQCMDTYDHKRFQPSQQKPASSQQSRTCRTFARPVPWYAATVIYRNHRNQQRKKQKSFSVLRKKEQSQKQKKITATFRMSLFLIKYRMRYVIYMPANTNDLAIIETMVAYGNLQNATPLAQANKSDLLWSLKHLMKTRLKALSVHSKMFEWRSGLASLQQWPCYL